MKLAGVRVGAAKVDLRFYRVGAEPRWDADVRGAPLEVCQEAWQPWGVAA